MATKERPIIFDGKEVRAILNGRKVQKRDVVDPQPTSSGRGQRHWCQWRDLEYPRTKLLLGKMVKRCPYGQPGDRFYMQAAFKVRYDEGRNETHWTSEKLWATTHGRPYHNDGKYKRHRTASSMPYWLSVEQWPLVLLTSVQVERNEDGKWEWVREYEQIESN